MKLEFIELVEYKTISYVLSNHWNLYLHLFFIADKDEEWEAVKKLPPMTLRTALTYFLDITTPPSAYILRQMAGLAKDVEETQRLMQLAEVREYPPADAASTHCFPMSSQTLYF